MQSSASGSPKVSELANIYSCWGLLNYREKRRGILKCDFENLFVFLQCTTSLLELEVVGELYLTGNGSNISLSVIYCIITDSRHTEKYQILVPSQMVFSIYKRSHFFYFRFSVLHMFRCSCNLMNISLGRWHLLVCLSVVKVLG